MFFSLSKISDNRFPNHYQFDDWVLNCDNGWTKTDNTLEKGYNYPEIDHGNFAKITINDNDVSLETDKLRSFPLWWDDKSKTLSNLINIGQQIWSDEKVKIQDDHLVLEKNDIIGEVNFASTNVIDDVIDNLNQKSKRLQEKFSSLNKRLFLTGGIDTLMLSAILENQNVEKINYIHFDFDFFTNNNLNDIRKKFWGYRNIHHWIDPQLLITGGCGDEFTMRGPDTIALWSAWHDLDLIDMLKKSNGYHVDYFLLDKNIHKIKKVYEHRYELKEQYPTYESLVRQILNINSNDHQHWHLGNTIHWTPFKDIEILKSFLRLSYDDIITQILDAKISKTIIERLNPNLLKTLSDSKNHESRKNLDLV